MIFKTGTVKIAREESKEQRWHLQTFIGAVSEHICVCVYQIFKRTRGSLKYGKNHGLQRGCFVRKKNLVKILFTNYSQVPK